jgi:hypothetical protein
MATWIRWQRFIIIVFVPVICSGFLHNASAIILLLIIILVKAHINRTVEVVLVKALIALVPLLTYTVLSPQIQRRVHQPLPSLAALAARHQRVPSTAAVVLRLVNVNGVVVFQVFSYQIIIVIVNRTTAFRLFTPTVTMRCRLCVVIIIIRIFLVIIGNAAIQCGCLVVAQLNGNIVIILITNSVVGIESLIHVGFFIAVSIRTGDRGSIQ